ncbi:MAG: LysM peptidoglycan-binding domain-containing protein, partial [Candidatus Hydrogenedentes bacterium]|nr:LysM peptidoglycan-binding domain-containing protein [Candidatus Hydrogenedentota bacterium]
MRRFSLRRWARAVALLIPLGLASCVTTTTDTAEPVAADAAGIVHPAAEPRVTLDVEYGELGSIMRRIGEQSSASLVLMNGCERRIVGPINLVRASRQTTADTLAQLAGCAVQECASYSFIFPPGYEILADVSLNGRLAPAFNRTIGSTAFGCGLELSAVFCFLSQALDTAIVADNAIADAACGELSLGTVPVQSALEAILKSARVAQFEVDSTDEYIFLHMPGNVAPPSLLLNEDALNDRQKAYLEQEVSLILPRRPAIPGRLDVTYGSTPLSRSLAAISMQLGFPVVAEKGLEELPINPVVMNGVRVRTALDLLIRQWLVPEFGYEMRADRIVIRRRTQPEPEAPDAQPAPEPKAQLEPAPEPPPGAPAPAAPPAEAPEAAAKKAPPPPPPQGDKVVHTVEFGESAWGIATKYNVGIQEFLRWNNLSFDSVLHPGDECVVYLSKDAIPPEPKPEPPPEPKPEPAPA